MNKKIEVLKAWKSQLEGDRKAKKTGRKSKVVLHSHV